MLGLACAKLLHRACNLPLLPAGMVGKTAACVY